MQISAQQAPSLKVMAESKVDGIQKSTQFKVNPRKIEVEEGFNARPLDQDHIDSIKASIVTGAAIPAIFVRVDNGRVIVVDGHHRLEAYMQLIHEGFEVIRIDCTQFRGSDADRITHMLTSSQGKPLTPLEQGIQYKKLVGFGMSEREIAEKIGRSIVHVSTMLELSYSNSDVQGMVTRKEVAAHIAVEVVKKHGDKAGAVLSEHLEQAKKSGKKKITEKVIRKALLSDMEYPSPDAVIQAVANAFNIAEEKAVDWINKTANQLTIMA